MQTGTVRTTSPPQFQALYSTSALLNASEDTSAAEDDSSVSESEALQFPALVEETDPSFESLPLLVQLSSSQSSGTVESQRDTAYALVRVSPVATVAEVKRELAKQGVISADGLPNVQLCFGESTLSEDSPIAEYLLPELYDYSEALLRMVDQGGLDAERKQVAMERALQVIETLRSGVSSGRHPSGLADPPAPGRAPPGSERIQLPGIDSLPRPDAVPADGSTGALGATAASAIAAPLWMPTIPAVSPTGASVIMTDMNMPWSPLQIWSPMDMAEHLHQMEPTLFTPKGVSAVGGFVPSSANLRRQNTADLARSSMHDLGAHTANSGGPLSAARPMQSADPSTHAAYSSGGMPAESRALQTAAAGTPSGAEASSYTSDLTGQSHRANDDGAASPADDTTKAIRDKGAETTLAANPSNQRLLDKLDLLPERWVLESAPDDRKRSGGGNDSMQGTETSSGDSRPSRLLGLTAEERRLRRMEQNRKSAERSRLRKKELEQRYRMAVRQLTEENAELRRQLEAFREQIHRMQQLLAVQMRPNSVPMDMPSPE
jgi:hypothetical protein